MIYRNKITSIQPNDHSLTDPQAKNDQPDLNRRRVIQGAVLSTTAMVVPGVASAICNPAAHSLAKTENTMGIDSALSSEDVAIELVETETSLKGGKMARVTITNSSHRSIKLNHVSPGAISTQKGVYQLNATLSKNPLSLRSGGVYQFWLTPDDGTQALHSSRPKQILGKANISTTLEVSVKTKLDSGPWKGTQRVQALIA